MIVTALLVAAVRGSILLLVAAIAATALRSRPAALRHSIWTLAIASQLALPLVAMVMPQRTVNFGPVGAMTTRAATVVATSLMRPSSQVKPTVPATTTALTGPAPVAPTPAGQSSQHAFPDMSSTLRLLTLIWAAIAFVILLRFMIGTILVARETRGANRPISREWIILAGRIQEEMSLRRPAELVWGTKRAVPYTWGIFSPIVCLPSDADHWPADRLRMVMLHELAHVERFDAVTEVMAQVALVVFWFNPLLWLAVRRMRTEREHACDDRVLTHGVKPSTYVRELVIMMKSIGQGAVAPGFGAIAMARRSQFESRMLAVLDERTDRGLMKRRSIARVALVASAVMLGVAAVRPATAAPRAMRFVGDSATGATTWGQSDFDEMVADCRRPKAQVRAQYCDVRTIDLSGVNGTVSFNGGYIDGVIFTSKGAPRTLTGRALVRTEALTESDARVLATQVTTSVKDGTLHSEGPGGGRSNYWSVLYEVTLPPGRSVKARTELGQIGLRDFQGAADIAAVNGPLQVFGAAGDIRGRTESGPIFVGLVGMRWEGAGLDLQSENGAIYVRIPPGYSAHLVTGTTNGPLELAYQILVRRMNGKQIDADIGGGGPTVRVTTLNGPAEIR